MDGLRLLEETKLDLSGTWIASIHGSMSLESGARTYFVDPIDLVAGLLSTSGVWGTGLLHRSPVIRAESREAGTRPCLFNNESWGKHPASAAD